MLNGTIQDMLTDIPQTGKVEWISYRPSHRAPVVETEAIEALVGQGLKGDHYGKVDGKRQVTLIQAEHLSTVAALIGQTTVDPALLRRNIVVSGINLLALKEMQIRIGEDVILEISGTCPPCSRMEENLGHGGYHAMRGHGGMTAKVIQGGNIAVGATIELVPVAASTGTGE